MPVVIADRSAHGLQNRFASSRKKHLHLLNTARASIRVVNIEKLNSSVFTDVFHFHNSLFTVLNESIDNQSIHSRPNVMGAVLFYISNLFQ